MKKTLRINYPWPQLEKGQGFFIPCLDPEPIRQAGLRAALRHHITNAKATVVIHHGKLGVWFTR